MTQLQELQKNFNDKLANLKYEQAVNLLKLLSDDDYAQLCEDNKDLMGPISGPDGDTYLHRHDILDRIIETFTQYIENQTPDPNRMNKDELKQYIESLVFNLDESHLKTVALNIQNILGV